MFYQTVRIKYMLKHFSADNNVIVVFFDSSKPERVKVCIYGCYAPFFRGGKGRPVIVNNRAGNFFMQICVSFFYIFIQFSRIPANVNDLHMTFDPGAVVYQAAIVLHASYVVYSQCMPAIIRAFLLPGKGGISCSIHTK